MDEAGAIAHLTSYSGTDNDTTDFDLEDDDKIVPVVDEHTVATIVSEWASIPLGKLETSEMDRLVQLEDDMRLRVKGQDRAIQSVARAVRRARSGLRDPNRPIASFMFCGPTGTGMSKVRLAQILEGRIKKLNLLVFGHSQGKRNCVRHWQKPTLGPRRISFELTCRNIWRNILFQD